MAVVNEDELLEILESVGKTQPVSLIVDELIQFREIDLATVGTGNVEEIHRFRQRTNS